MDLKLAGQAVLITGANGGIGRALATAFAAEGCSLALLAGRNVQPLRAWVAEQPWAARAAVDGADVRDAEALQAAVARLSDQVGPLRHAVVNAGIWPQASLPLHHTPVERLRTVLDVNLLGALLTAQIFLAGLDGTEGPPPTLAFIGSTAGQFGEAGHVAYSASKAALRGVTLTLKNEIVGLHPQGRVNLVDPGWTRTPMAAQAMKDAAQVTRSLATTPLHKVAEADDVAHTVVFLASPLAGHLSGQVIGVHGGMEGRLLWG